MEFYSDIRDGRLQSNISKQIKDFLPSLENKRVVIKIDKVKSNRSLAQNSYLHLLFTMFKDALNELGNNYTMEEVKELCKAKFSLIDVVNESTGECIGQRIKGTHEMGKVEMCEFVEKIIIWAASYFNITLPYPNENVTFNFGNDEKI